MDAGKLNERIALYGPIVQPGEIALEQKAEVWAKAERLKGRGVFASYGMSAEQWEFTMRKREVAFEDCIQWKGSFYYITAVTEKEQKYTVITAVTCEIKAFTLIEEKRTQDELGRPQMERETGLVFYGVLTEKYMGRSFEEPHYTAEEGYILVTPRTAELKLDGLLQQGEGYYTIIARHMADPHRNEYEIVRQTDI